MSACESLNPDTWFEGEPDYDKDLAVAVCCSCPLITPCLKMALAAEVTQRNQGRPAGSPLLAAERFGIYGGMLPWQRAEFALRDRRNASTGVAA